MFTNRLQQLNIDERLFEKALESELMTGRGNDYIADAEELAKDRFISAIKVDEDDVVQFSNWTEGGIFSLHYEVDLYGDFVIDGVEYYKVRAIGTNGRIWNIVFYDNDGLENYVEEFAVSFTLLDRLMTDSKFDNLMEQIGLDLRRIELSGADAGAYIKATIQEVDEGWFLLERLEQMTPEELEEWKTDNYVCEECGELVG